MKKKSAAKKNAAEVKSEEQKDAIDSKDYASLLKVVVLKHIQSSCEKFEVDFISRYQSGPEMMNYFKYPNATYLTGELFHQLSVQLEKGGQLINSEKSKTNLAEQYSFQYTLSILATNFKALSFCGVSLPSIMEDSEYEQFMKNYTQYIAKFIEQGYKKDFKDDDATQEAKGIWITCESICRDILSSSVNLIFASPQDIVANLET